MIDITEAVALKVTRIRTTFSDDIGNQPRHCIGTAFWLETAEGNYVLVTNRHNVDPRLLFADPDGWDLTSVEIELRWVEDEEADDPTKGRTEFFAISEPETRLFLSPNDCALLADPFDARPHQYAHQGISHFHEQDLATEQYLIEEMAMLAPVFFIGFPNTWWDQERTLPIARMANVGSMGEFHNAGIKTGDVCLVTGLSFGGSSGSPVVAFGKQVAAGSLGSYNLPPKLVGVMSGHFPFKEQDRPGMPLHAGLSYFTRSTSILGLIEQARAQRFRNVA
jgi:hypothetical protein